MAARREITKKFAREYVRADKHAKGEILDGLVAAMRGDTGSFAAGAYPGRRRRPLWLRRSRGERWWSCPVATQPWTAM